MSDSKQKSLQSDKGDLVLGKEVAYPSAYSPELLCVLPRGEGRHVEGRLPFMGSDRWYAYELSWLNPKGKPVVAMGCFIIPCESMGLIESKSLKLYLNSFNQTAFESLESVQNTLLKDFSAALGVDVRVELQLAESFSDWPGAHVRKPEGICIDDEDVLVSTYSPSADLLNVEAGQVEREVLYSNLLKSNCPVTGQPDWATVLVSYKGKKINRQSLLLYICSYRQHSGFHEQCVEQIFKDILQHCEPEFLAVEACYTRRGGLDINPFRTNAEEEFSPLGHRCFRQ